ncbi:unnamed protein product [Diamesa hyperborea]
MNLDEIKRIPKEEFSEILKNWMDQKDVTQKLQRKLRKQLFNDFQKTSLGQKIEYENKRFQFNTRDNVFDILQSEHFYNQNHHFTLSIWYSESKYSKSFPNYESEERFRFDRHQINELFTNLGIQKNDILNRKVQTSYKNTKDSLLNILFQELLSSHKNVESENMGTQTDEIKTLDKPDLDISLYSSKSKKRQKRKNHGLVQNNFKMHKTKKSKSGDVNLIVKNLEKMSNNIGLITEKLDDFQKSPNQNIDHEDTRSIIHHVGKIVGQLDGCVGNFERLCNDINTNKSLFNETCSKSYQDWMNDLQHSDNGKRFLKKLQKSFSKVMSEEKTLIKKDYRQKLSNERYKLSKRARARSTSRSFEENRYQPPNEKPREVLNDLNTIPTVLLPEPDNMVREINDLFQNTCQIIKNMEKESELFEKSIELDIKAKQRSSRQKVHSSHKKEFLTIPKQIDLKHKQDLNNCQKLNLTASSSNENYGSTSFEDDINDD